MKKIFTINSKENSNPIHGGNRYDSTEVILYKLKTDLNAHVKKFFTPKFIKENARIFFQSHFHELVLNRKKFMNTLEFKKKIMYLKPNSENVILSIPHRILENNQGREIYKILTFITFKVIMFLHNYQEFYNDQSYAVNKYFFDFVYTKFKRGNFFQNANNFYEKTIRSELEEISKQIDLKKAFIEYFNSVKYIESIKEFIEDFIYNKYLVFCSLYSEYQIGQMIVEVYYNNTKNKFLTMINPCLGTKTSYKFLSINWIQINVSKFEFRTIYTFLYELCKFKKQSQNIEKCHVILNIDESYVFLSSLFYIISTINYETSYLESVLDVFDEIIYNFFFEKIKFFTSHFILEKSELIEKGFYEYFISDNYNLKQNITITIKNMDVTNFEIFYNYLNLDRNNKLILDNFDLKKDIQDLAFLYHHIYYMSLVGFFTSTNVNLFILENLSNVQLLIIDEQDKPQLINYALIDIENSLKKLIYNTLLRLEILKRDLKLYSTTMFQNLNGKNSIFKATKNIHNENVLEKYRTILKKLSIK